MHGIFPMQNDNEFFPFFCSHSHSIFTTFCWWLYHRPPKPIYLNRYYIINRCTFFCVYLLVLYLYSDILESEWRDFHSCHIYFWLYFHSDFLKCQWYFFPIINDYRGFYIIFRYSLDSLWRDYTHDFLHFPHLDV